MDEVSLSYCLALSHTLLPSAVLLRLLETFQTPQLLWESSPALLQSHLTPSLYDKFVAARHQISPMALLSQYALRQIQVISITDPAYPPLLQVTADPPIVLFVRGNLAVCQSRPVAIVGTRRVTPYGKKATTVLIEQLQSHRACIVSGLAAGVDTVAHQSALKYKLPTVAVFGTGIDQIYPRENEGLATQIIAEGGAVVSELPLGVSGTKFTFPKRNRIIAGLSEGTVVIEGPEKSGSLITARIALEENRPVLALPGNIFDPCAAGPNRLIQEGAHPVLTGADIAQYLGWTTDDPRKHGSQMTLSLPKKAIPVPSTLSSIEQSVLQAIYFEPTSFEAIHHQLLTLPIPELQRTLTMLEFQGLIQSLPGAKFARH